MNPTGSTGCATRQSIWAYDMKRLILLLALGVAGAVIAQTTIITTANTPRTFFEIFKATPDALLIRGMTTIGTLSSENGAEHNGIDYPVEIRVERLSNPLTSNSVYAVSLRTGVAPQMQIDYVDYDELNAVIRSVQFISQSSSAVTPLDNYETIFRTRGGLAIAKIGKSDKTTIVMTSGDVNGVRNQMAPFNLDKLGALMVAAKAKIDALVVRSQQMAARQ
jgi:hypothetical protein